MTRRRLTHIWIVRANSVLEAAFSSEQVADDYCFLMNSEDRIAQQEASKKGILRPRTYWAWEKFQVRDEVDPKANGGVSES